MKKENALWLLIAVIGFCFTSCLDDDYFQELFEKRYNKQWEDIFGKMDPGHDWNIIKQVEATINVPAGDEYTVRIYTTHPKDKRSRLVAQLQVEDTGIIRFDLEKISKDVYARVKDAQGKTAFEGYFAINGDEVLIDEGNMVSRLASRAVSGRDLNNVKEHNIGKVYRDGNNEENELRPVTSTNTVDLGKLYYFDNQLDFNSSTDRICLNFKDSIYPIIHNRNDAIFQEMKDNRNHMNTKGVEYVTISEDEIELSYIYGATGLYNSFGYFYWDPKTDGVEGYKNARKFILVNNACPQNNIKAADNKETTWENATKFNEGMGIAFVYFMNDIVPSYIYGTKYKLVYYGNNYEIKDGTYTFPKDIHIGFFLYTTYWDSQAKKDESNYLPDTPGNYAYSTKAPLEADNQQYRKNLVYSIPQYNNFIKENYNYRINEKDYLKENQKENSGVDPNSGEISAVTYKYQGRKFLGFEDGVDKDMNDILLLVDADVRVVGEEGKIEDIEEKDSTYAQSWIIACEDLGNIGDYDFNDAVFKVSHVAGTDQLTVTPLAAGGTYSIEVRYKDKNISQYDENGNFNNSKASIDFHKLINPEATQKNNGLWEQINDKQKGQGGTPIIIKDENIKYYFSLANNNYYDHGFSVYVQKNNGPSITINQPGDKKKEAPQMLILPEYWIWPYEGRSIHSAYEGFLNWNTNMEANKDWYTQPNKDQSLGYLVDYNFTNYPNNNENEGGNTGGNTGNEESKVYWDYWTLEKEHCYSISSKKLKEIVDGFNTLRITIKPKNGNDQAGLYHDVNNPAGSALKGLSESSTTIIIDINTTEINEWQKYEKIYTSLFTNGEINNITIEPIINIPTTIQFTINGKTSSLEVQKSGVYNDGYYIKISKEHFNEKGSKVQIFANGTINAQIFKGNSSGGNDFDFTQKDGIYYTELTTDNIKEITVDPVILYFYNNTIANVVSISITDLNTISPTTLDINSYFSNSVAAIPFNVIPVGTNGIKIEYKYVNSSIVNVVVKNEYNGDTKRIEGKDGLITINKTEFEDFKEKSKDQKLYIENYNQCTEFIITAIN